jgi:allantoicase
MQIELLACLHPHTPEAIIEIDLGVDDNKSWVNILQKLSCKGNGPIHHLHGGIVIHDHRALICGAIKCCIT